MELATVNDIKNIIFNDLMVWDFATADECEWTEPLVNFYRLWEIVNKRGWKKDYLSRVIDSPMNR